MGNGWGFPRREVARHGGRPVYRANETDYEAWEVRLAAKAAPSCRAQAVAEIGPRWA